jgi:DNA mismatch endonuclease, patch repair protein
MWGISKMDCFTAEKRSAITSTDTAPELAVRRLLHRWGFRFRLHRRDLPGTRDVVLPRYRAAVFVHGCFWHSHRRCPRSTVPQTNCAYWTPKLAKTVRRDSTARRALQGLGWKVFVIWECETARVETLTVRLQDTLGCLLNDRKVSEK